MSDGAGGIGSVSNGAASLGGFDARLQAAQMGRLQAQVQEAAGAADKVRAESAGKMDPKETARLQKVSKDFESIFLAYMLKTMRQSVDKEDGLVEESQGEQIFGEMRDEELSKNMANAGGIGLSRLLVEQLKQTIETQKSHENQV